MFIIAELYECGSHTFGMDVYTWKNRVLSDPICHRACIPSNNCVIAM